MLYAMIAGQYPFARPEDKVAGVNEHQRRQNVINVCLCFPAVSAFNVSIFLWYLPTVVVPII